MHLWHTRCVCRKFHFTASTKYTETVKPRYLVISKLEKCGGWISSRRQDKDQRWQTAAVTEGTWQVERRRFYKLLSDFLRHKFNNGRDDFVWSHCAQYEQPLKWAEMFFELSRQLCMVRFLHRINTSLNCCIHTWQQDTTAKLYQTDAVWCIVYLLTKNPHQLHFLIVTYYLRHSLK